MVKDSEDLMQSETQRGTILFAHGSRDPLWRQPIEAVASHIRAIAPAVHVRCAYLELTDPDLPASVDELAALGVTSITVVPMFLGVGRHAREDLPLLMTGLQASHPHIAFILRPAIGEEAQMIELMARIALS
ncbi:MAG: CbiX/SirB N-terminal domain-containing protein [Rhodoferax sp.]|nr:CbiX/SirB N-terminal domain-containing protein [Rhodoferax sp.]